MGAQPSAGEMRPKPAGHELQPAEPAYEYWPAGQGTQFGWLPPTQAHVLKPGFCWIVAEEP